jgi:acyl dehydratase
MTPRVGDELPELVKHPTTRQLVQYAGASGDLYEMHYDQEFARALELPGVILHGLLKTAFLGELATKWSRDWGRLTVLDATYRGMDLPRAPLRCRARVSAVRGRNVDLEVWTEDARGGRTTIGTATIESRT